MQHVLAWIPGRVTRQRVPSSTNVAANSSLHHTLLRKSIHTEVQQTSLSSNEYKRIARSLQGKSCNRDAARSLTLYLRTSRDPRKREIAQVALNALQNTQSHDEMTGSLALAARLAAEDSPTFASFERICKDYPKYTPCDADYIHLLYTLCRQRNYDALRLYGVMREKGIAIPSKALNAILSTALVCAPMHEVRSIVHELGGCMKLNLVGLTSVLQSYCNRYADQNAIQRGFQTADVLRDAPREDEVDEVAETLMMRLQQSKDTIAWHAYFTYLGLFQSTESMMNFYHSVVVCEKFSPDSWTLSALSLVHIHNSAPGDCDEALALLTKLTAATSLRSNRFVIGTLTQVVLGYTIRIGNAKFTRPPCDPSRTIEAQTFIKEACEKYNIIPDKAMLQPLIEAHCNEFVPNFNAAYELIRELHPDTGRSLFWRKQKSEPQTDFGSYYPLLSACVRLHDVGRALMLLREMQHLCIPSQATMSLITQLWGICTTYSEAWDVYKCLKEIGAWTTASYSHAIALCCRLRLCNSAEDDYPSPVPPSYPLRLLGDMRNEHMHPSTETYTIILNYYAKSSNATLSSVQATHELIKRDIHLEPDLILINALMNAYNHVDAPAQVLGIWDSLLVLCNNAKSLEFLDDVSLVIVLDACGHAKLLSAARRALDSAQQLEKKSQKGKILGKNVMDAWIECLARCGELNEAVEAAFSLQSLADKKTIETLMRFVASAHVRNSISTEKWDGIRGRIQAEYPHLWDEVATIR